MIASLPKSVVKREIDIERIAKLTDLPNQLWISYAEFAANPDPSIVYDEQRRFFKSIERHYLYDEG